ncbi:MAG: hypothetical protein KDD11_23260, partial [Acidobacteria bacterium]|nr:hypothetical protein [Acidobacteriota bacterium]
AHPHLPLARSELRFLGEGEIAGDLIGALADVPVIGLVARLPRVVEQAGRAVREWWTRRGQEELRNIAALSEPAEVEEWLPAFFAADLADWCQEEGGRRVVIFVDTFEALWVADGRGTRGAAPDEWVRDWAGYLENVLLVVAGRSPLRWLEEDDSWR